MLVSCFYYNSYLKSTFKYSARLRWVQCVVTDLHLLHYGQLTEFLSDFRGYKVKYLGPRSKLTKTVSTFVILRQQPFVMSKSLFKSFSLKFLWWCLHRFAGRLAGQSFILVFFSYFMATGKVYMHIHNIHVDGTNMGPSYFYDQEREES